VLADETVCPEATMFAGGDSCSVAIVTTGWTGTSNFISFSMDLEFNDTHLDFVRVDKSDLTDGWWLSSAGQYATGLVRFQSSDDDFHTQSDPDTLGYFIFARTSGCGNRQFTVDETYDNLGRWDDNSPCSDTVHACGEGQGP
jgi:hypothetical protein